MQGFVKFVQIHLLFSEAVCEVMGGHILRARIIDGVVVENLARSSFLGESVQGLDASCFKRVKEVVAASGVGWSV